MVSAHEWQSYERTYENPSQNSMTGHYLINQTWASDHSSVSTLLVNMKQLN